jgi:succinoglycan biosynthesis transport protein ExoP
MESIQQQSFPITEARVITRASSPPGPSSPRTLFILAIAGFGGAVLGLGVALFRDISDRVFRNGMQVETTLLTNCIAMVPKFDCTKSIVRDRNLPCGTVDMPLSRFTEAIRSIKVAADLSAARKASKVIGFTSSLPNEGKSTVAANLAQLIAHGGARTILVDCDLRNPWLSQVLARTAKVGSLDVISGKASLDEAVWNDHITNVAFLPAVSRSHLQYSSEILGSDEMKKLFDELRRRYEWVVVDFSPLAPVVDVRSTTHLVDSYVLVIEWGRTKIDAVEHALHSAKGVYENLLGAVLNKVDVRQLRNYDRGNYYQNKHYARYGYTE